LAQADWPAFGGGPEGGQHSALAQIKPGNVAELQVAWTYHTGELPPSRGQSLETTMLHVNGNLYLCTPGGRIVALDPANGKERWATAPGAEGDAGAHGVGTCRGVAYWQSATPTAVEPCAKRVFIGRRGPEGPRFYAVDADSGAACADFGAAAGHPGYVAFADFDWGGDVKMTATSSPGVIYHDLLIVGEGVADNVRADAADGIVRAFDVRSGALTWSFNPIPPALTHATGAANVWSLMSVDTRRGLVFLPTTSPSPDLFGGARTADMPLADAVVALKADTGEVVWSFQTVHHDLYDFDLPAQPILATVPFQGHPTDVVIQTAKTGFTFVLDRETGRSLFPIEERPVPQSDVPGERSSATQPVPSLPEPFARQTFTRADLFGLTPIDRAACQRLFDQSRYDGLFTPVSLRGSIMFPSLIGGGNWGGAAYDPATHLLVVKASNLAYRVTLIDRKSDPGPPKRAKTWMDAPMEGTPYRMEGEILLSPLGIPCAPPPWGTLTAIDLDTGKKVWQIPLGQSKRFGITAPAFLGWGSPNVGGPLVTASGLVFIGATLDSQFRAYDLKSGRELWRAPLPAPGMAVPMSYLDHGRQYVVIAAGGNAIAETELSDAFVAYALPGR
jgi:quinoprotein glucose dehydrogenase